MDFQELIPVVESSINDETRMTCNARELHAFLGVESRFNDWITNRINKYDFVENIDYLSFTEISVKPQGGRPTNEYYTAYRNNFSG